MLYLRHKSTLLSKYDFILFGKWACLGQSFTEYCLLKTFPKTKVVGQMILEHIAYYIKISKALTSSIARRHVYHCLTLNLLDQGSLLASNTSCPLWNILLGTLVWTTDRQMIMKSMVGCE